LCVNSVKLAQQSRKQDRKKKERTKEGKQSAEDGARTGGVAIVHAIKTNANKPTD
jgi:hypothetical protein